MPAWLPIVKALMPHVAQIVSAAAPAFTARPGMTAEQISELQAAAKRNDESIRVLAEEAQQFTKALDELNAATQKAQRQLEMLRYLAYAGLALGLMAAILAIVLMVTR